MNGILFLENRPGLDVERMAELWGKTSDEEIIKDAYFEMTGVRLPKIDVIDHLTPREQLTPQEAALLSQWELAILST